MTAAAAGTGDNVEAASRFGEGTKPTCGRTRIASPPGEGTRAERARATIVLKQAFHGRGPPAAILGWIEILMVAWTNVPS